MKCYNEILGNPEKMYEGEQITITAIDSFKHVNRYTKKEEVCYVFRDGEKRFYAPASFNRYALTHDINGLIGARVEVRSRIVNNIISLFIETIG